MDDATRARLDGDQMVVLGTLLSGVINDVEAIDLGKKVKADGGLELFDQEWSCELWRRADAALKDNKPTKAYRHEKQVCDVPNEIWGRVLESEANTLLVETVYLPELVKSARERKIRRACQGIAQGGDVDRALDLVKEASREVLNDKTKVQLASEAIGEWQDAFQHKGEISGITSGILDLDRLTWGWQPENLIVIGARPSQGKTAMLLGFARAAAIENNVPTLFVTLESSPKELVKRLACQIAKANQRDLRGGCAPERDMMALVPAFEKIQEKPIHFRNCIGFNINAVASTMRTYHQQHGIKLAIVDYLQKIKPTERHEKRTYEVAQTSEGLKMIAEELQIPVITAAQLNREPEKAKAKGRVPVLSDLADSGQIERDADLVGLLHKREQGFVFILAKFRDGPTGIVDLHFIPGCARFDNAAKIDEADLPRQRKDIDD